MNLKMQNEKSRIRFTILQSLCGLALVGVACKVYVMVGPLSSLVAGVAAMLICGLGFRYLNGWSSYTLGRKRVAGLFVFVCFGFVVIVAGVLWMQTDVRADRLKTIYNSGDTGRDLDVSIVLGKRGEFVNVSGSVESEADFNKLRTDIVGRFDSELKPWIQWNITTVGGLEFSGADRELFPGDYP